VTAVSTTTTATTPAPGLDPDLRAVPRPNIIRRLFASTSTWVLLVDVVLVAVFQVLSPEGAFLSLANVQSLLLGGTEALLLALGIAILMGSGVIDFSIGGNLVLSSVTGALTVQAIAGRPDAAGHTHDVGLAIIAGLVVAIGTGIAFGLLNGLIIAYVKINPLIATLGTAGIALGIALVITNGGNVSGLPTELQTSFGLNTIAYIPLPAFVAIVLAILVHLMLRYTRFGMRLLGMGSSRSAADRSGVDTKSMILRLTMMAGAFAGIAGFVDIARFASTSSSGHASDALNAVTAVIIGGTLLEGGRVSILGAIWGTALAIILQQGLIVVGVPGFYQQIAIGAVLVLAVSVDRIRVARQRV
jgi:ribose transport system permease protein